MAQVTTLGMGPQRWGACWVRLEGVLRWCLAALRAPRAPEGRKRADLRGPGAAAGGQHTTAGRPRHPWTVRAAHGRARRPERCQARTVASGRKPRVSARGRGCWRALEDSAHGGACWRDPGCSAHGTAGGGAGEARGAGALRRVVATARGSRPAGRVLTGPREPSRAVDPLLAPNRARAPGLARAGHDQRTVPRPAPPRPAGAGVIRVLIVPAVAARPPARARPGGRACRLPSGAAGGRNRGPAAACAARAGCGRSRPGRRIAGPHR